MSEENIKVSEEAVDEKEKKVEAPAEQKTFDQIIEEERHKLYKSYTTSRRVSNILMFATVAAICGIMFLIISKIPALRITGYALAGAILVGMIVYYLLNRKKFPNKTRDYVALVSKTLNAEMFKNQEFKEINSNPEEKLAMDDLVADGIYSGASGINSRNVIHGVYKNGHFLYAEAALVRPSTRKQQVPPLFVGRYISIPNEMKFDGRFVFVFKNAKEPLDLPNAVSDLEVLEEKDDFVVYGPKGSNYHNVIKNDVLSQLRRIEVGGHLLNVNVVFWSGHTAVYLSYDDTIMSVPFDKPIDKAGFEKSFDDLQNSFDAIAGK